MKDLRSGSGAEPATCTRNGNYGNEGLGEPHAQVMGAGPCGCNPLGGAHVRAAPDEEACSVEGQNKRCTVFLRRAGASTASLVYFECPVGTGGSPQHMLTAALFSWAANATHTHTHQKGAQKRSLFFKQDGEVWILTGS
eukprot:1157448-Pelagomonas_calceolata.AAC.3